MRAGWRARAGLMLALLVSGAVTGSCAGGAEGLSGDEDSGGGGDGAAGEVPGGKGGRGGASNGAGGSADAGAAGDAGSGGASYGDASAGAGGSGGSSGSGGSAGMAGCALVLQPIFPARLLDLTAGPTASLRIGAIATTPLNPGVTWTWTVTRPNTLPVAFTPDPADPSVITIPLREPGGYLITASVGGSCASAFGVATAVTEAERLETFLVRIVPPNPLELARTDTDITVPAGQAMHMEPLKIAAGKRTSIMPIDASGLRGAVPAYVRVVSDQQSFVFEGDTRAAPFVEQLHPTLTYDLLIVPFAENLPPLRLARRSAAAISGEQTLGPGVPFAGNVLGPGGQALAGARVVLHAQGATSTRGTTGAETGAFVVRVQSSTAPWGLWVQPAQDSGLPDVRLPDSAGLVVGGAGLSAEIRYAALIRAPLGLVVKASGGQPVSGARVLVEADEAPGIAIVTPAGGAAMPAAGYFRAEATTDQTGAVSFVSVPRLRYRVTVAPPAGAADGLTTRELDLRGTAPTLGLSVSLRPRVDVTGQLGPHAAGGRIRFVDESPVAGRAPALGTVGADGSFRVSVDPARKYRVVWEPASLATAARALLGRLEVGEVATSLSDRRVPKSIPYQGTLTKPDSKAVAGALVQIYCVRDTPGCVNVSKRSLEAAEPLYETVSASDGQVRGFVPDPAEF